MEPGDLATWIGVAVAFCAGAGGVVVGILGLITARQAKSVAARANDLAEASLVGDDVAWALSWNMGGAATLSNTGTDVAVNVRGSVTVDGETATFGPVSRVNGLGGVPLTFMNAGVALAAEEARKNNGVVTNGYVLFPDEHEMNHRVSWRITWETTLGRTMPTDAQVYIDQPIVYGTRVPWTGGP